ncbi:hypothetical protein [Halomarina litorea]|uniref:hypothetical protein n=1 Tax=Halomarina litorea TaxID=2961595 RepID=UPI0020C47E6D|nr:hypothetical protein [Halomarina sp. BCD28]
MTDPTRRRVLATGGLLAAGATGAVVGSSLLGDGGNRTPERTDANRTRTAGSATATPGSDATGREDFVWAERDLWREAGLRRNLLAFAARNGLAMMVAQADATDRDGVDRLSTVLDAAAARDVPVWLNTGVLKSLTAEAFVSDPDARERHLDALRRVARRYGEAMPEGRLVLWQEAPVAGDWVEGGAWNDQSVENLQSYGPEIFEAQLAAVNEAAPDVAVGTFLHFPYVVESRQPAVFADLMDALADRDARPDFVFTDFYRGWYEKDVGPGPANAAVRSLVANARRHADAPALFLGQAHTVNPRHTPSKAAMRMDLRAATGAGAAGVGWYARTAYKQTRTGFDPYLPNRAGEDAVPDAPRVNTLTVARDRYLFAYAQTLATARGPDARPRVDLWLHGSSLGFHDHAVSVRTAEGWTFVGDVSGYAAGTYAGDGDHVSVFHALDDVRFVREGTLDVRIETPDDGNAGHLHGVSVLPFDAGLYVSELEATRLVADRDVSPVARGTRSVDAALDPGGRVEVSVPVSDPDRPLASLVHPGWGDTLDALASAERSAGFDPDAAFDLWVVGRGAAGAVADLGSLFPDAASAPEPAATASGDGTAVAYGLSRESILGEYASVTLGEALDRAGDGVRALYAMPYFGRDDFYAPGRAARLVREMPGQVETFSVATKRR